MSANEPNEAMVQAALEQLDYLRVSCRINLNYYIDERVIADLYRMMKAVRVKSAQLQS